VNADSIAVIRTRLPYVDRRALSEAWFSALHLAHEERKAPHAARRAGPSSESPAAKISLGSGASGPAAGSLAARVPTLRARSVQALAIAASPTPLRKTGGAVVVPFPARGIRYAPVRASFGIGLGGGRVQIVLRREGPLLHVVAICSRRHVELVRRALACADLHLRLRGETIRSSVRAFEASER
jgi:hypothetical protein